jgi:ATP-dependent Clp protease adapter protein ClpS
MASYLVDLVLLAALLFTSIRVTKMHRELVRLRACQSDFAFVLGKTTETVDDMVLMVREFSAEGKQLVNVLGTKVEEARKLVMQIEAHGDASCGIAQAVANRADNDANELARRGSTALASLSQ